VSLSVSRPLGLLSADHTNEKRRRRLHVKRPFIVIRAKRPFQQRIVVSRQETAKRQSYQDLVQPRGALPSR
jgi:hypothetical protein